MIEIFSSGGGTQSTAIAALIVLGKLPKPDIAVIADTGREMPTTWEYLDEITAPALASVGVEIHRVKKDDYAYPSERGLFGSKGSLLMPAYTTQEGDVSKLSGFCSNAWKVHVIKNWLSREMGVKPNEARRWIGFSMDESRRVLRMKSSKDWEKGLIRFPLVHDVMMFRQDSINLVKEIFGKEPPRSRCYDCPHQSDYEWRQVQERPEVFEKACATDEEIRLKDPHAWLHKKAVPLREVDLSPEEDLFGSCPSGICFV